MWGPQPISIVQQREVKRDPIVSGEKIQIGFALNASKESRTFLAVVRAKTAEDSVNYFGDRFSSASHILCLHLRPRSLVSCFKKEMACSFLQDPLFRCIRHADVGEKTACLVADR